MAFILRRSTIVVLTGPDAIFEKIINIIFPTRIVGQGFIHPHQLMFVI